jgi:hypothetical protein
MSGLSTITSTIVANQEALAAQRFTQQMLACAAF